MNRRKFIQSAAMAAAGPLLFTNTKLFGADAPSNKLNLALIGTWGRGEAHFSALKSQNVVALCDINDDHLAFGAKQFPKAAKYIDWRKLLDDHQKLGLDGVIICTADHHHAFISNWALNRGLHVYCEKPLANTIEEARVVRANYLSKKNKLATQVGMQRHAFQNFNRLRELVRGNAIGELSAAYAWGNRQIRRPGYYPSAGNPPSNLHYDLWLGPAPYHPYNPGYFKGGPGANCLEWNMFWDFGNGQIGDMGSHTMDLLWNVVDAQYATTAEASGEAFNKDVSPVTMESHFENPANDWRGPIKISWYQGGAMPKSPVSWLDLNKIDHGAMFKGSKGFIVANFTSRMIIPVGDGADMTYYKSPAKDELLPTVGGFQEEWFNACKSLKKTSCDFDYSGTMIEQMLLGLVAYRAGKKIEYDGSKGVVTNDADANQYLSRQYRAGYTLNG